MEAKEKKYELAHAHAHMHDTRARTRTRHTCFLFVNEEFWLTILRTPHHSIMLLLQRILCLFVYFEGLLQPLLCVLSHGLYMLCCWVLLCYVLLLVSLVQTHDYHTARTHPLFHDILPTRTCIILAHTHMRHTSNTHTTTLL